MARRNKIGSRRYIATFFSHDGTVDSVGQPTFNDPAAWQQVIGGWPCECLATSGSETLRGQQVTAQTKRVLYGDFAAVAIASARMRCKVDGIVSDVISVLDDSGEKREMRIQLGEEQ